MTSDVVTIVGRARLVLSRGDITRESTDAIVNAADPSLMGGGGVDGAIHRAGGESILRECQVICRSLGGELTSGEAVITGGGRLPARFVIHTAGPIWEGGDQGEAETLARCYKSSLAIADERGLASVAFPSISTGIYGYPVDLAAGVALGTVRVFLETATSLTLVRFVLFDGATFDAYRDALGN